MNIYKEELAALVERVRGLKGPDREVDWRIADATNHPSFEKRFEHMWPPFGPKSKLDRDIPAYTGSIDAIRALTDPLLDGGNGRPLLYGRTSEWAAMALPEHQYTETLNFAVGEAPALQMLTVSERAETECAAAILALLLSLQSQEPTP